MSPIAMRRRTKLCEHVANDARSATSNRIQETA